ncbi:hypothetical protein PP633_06155 [Mycobacteroides abscessus]|uniref:hypothetical protein n=1 Tax=Mycobacteroides abscessus TaxID=36809 RepID=UPI0005E76077|nr:hypothetical protein [Mycobacteroides abscessus]MDM2642456.1 hypothetical protein [Mycobacteroides abscessus]MDM2652257.1 hypothetical protein [Mycobacteroides abscessus]MDM2662836.1 hypothetical protein [Mycobacteroides abscessus]MDM2667944.1 hypothetical protein [Mycobacteroides abscessus]MDM2673352.1 hypothetical protein [Mycobacteroides abscessus]
MSDPLFTAAKLLESHGYAVVELPKPVGVNGADNAVWSHQPHYIEQEFNGDLIIDDRISFAAADLHALAEIFAAAAKRAGRVSDGRP